MDIISSVIKFAINLLNTLLPKMGVPDSFFATADAVISTLITIIQWGSWFVPLDLLVICFTVMLIADNYALLARVVQWIIRLVRG